MAEWGAFAFGIVLGWFVYFTNRYRKGDAQFSDLTALIGVIGGGAVTTLFGDAKTALFGAYGIGLAVGFFAYFLVLIVLVSRSGGKFTATWFLDGRRKKLTSEEEIPADTRTTLAPMAMPWNTRSQQLLVEQPLVQAGGKVSDSALKDTVSERDRAMIAINNAITNVLQRIAESEDETERAQLRIAHRKLADKNNEILAVRLKTILESDSVRQAIVQLHNVTTDLVETAKEMTSAADAISTTAVIVDKATKVVSALAAVFG